MATLQDLKTRLDQHRRAVTMLEGQRRELERQYQTVSEEIVVLQHGNQVLELTLVLFDKMLKDLVTDSLEKIKTLVTAGLKAIFDDRQLAFDLELGMERKQPSLVFFLLDEQHNIRAPIRGNFGGGPVAVADMLLRVICILRLGLSRVMVLDEALSQVSSGYLPNAGVFLRQICEKLGMSVLLVTHSDFKGSADRIYQASLKNGSLRLEQDDA